MNSSELEGIAHALEKEAERLMEMAARIRQMMVVSPDSFADIRDKAVSGKLTAKDVAPLFMLNSVNELRHAVARKGTSAGGPVRVVRGLVNVFGCPVPEFEIKKALGYKPPGSSPSSVLDDWEPIL